MVQKIELKNLEAYLGEIGKFPILEQEDEKKIQNEIERKENKQKLFNSNLRLVVSVAKNMLGYGLSIEDLIKVGNEELERAIENFNTFSANKPDATTSGFYTWRVKYGLIREIVSKKFPALTVAIVKSLKENDFDGYYNYFFLEHVLINLIMEKENNSKDALAILENSLISTFSDPNLKDRISDGNFIREIPAFMDLVKSVNPEIAKG